ncbi:MAG: O-antigen ligase family protein [Bacteroidota bacterium]
MTEKFKIKLFYSFLLVYIGLSSLFVIYELFWLLALPLIIFIAVLFLFSYDKVLYLIAFSTPLAIKLDDKDFGFAVSIPTEPLMFILLVLFLLRLLYENNYDKKILRHPITIIVLLNLGWMAFTSVTSSMPLVSFKFFLSRLWFVVAFYFILLQILKDYNKIRFFLWLYLVPLSGVIIYTIVNHSNWGFDQVTSHWVMTPFYNDHTAYGAILGLFFPIVILFFVGRENSGFGRYISILLFILFIVAIILSYARATWVSVLFAITVSAIVLLRIKLVYVGLAAVILGGWFIMNMDQIFMKMEKNKQDSSSDIAKHVQSISNISSDASNLERINRWNCAIRMFKSRPVLGWGPGTYQFQYGTFQMSYDKTIISTNFGNMGTAHSEYLGPLSESGLLGGLLFMALVVTVLYRGIIIAIKGVTRKIRQMSLAIVMGLITYFIHGVLNNFLDTDKLSVPFWGFVAIIVALDLYHNKKEDQTEVVVQS